MSVLMTRSPHKHQATVTVFTKLLSNILKHKSSSININHTYLWNSVVDYVRCNRIHSSEFVLQQNTNCDINYVLEKQGYDVSMPMSCSYVELPCFIYAKYINFFFHMMFFGPGTIKSIHGELHW